MANIKSAKKRARQNDVKRARNSSYRTSVRSAVKATRSAVSSKSKETQDLLKKAVSALQKAGNKGLYHKNTVARKISRLSRQAASTVSK